MTKDPSKIPFSQVMQALLDDSKPFQARYLYRLSDLSTTDLATLSITWASVPQRRRQAVMEDVLEMSGSDYLLNFNGLGRLALQDQDPLVRVLAIQTLQEYEEPDFISVFIEMMLQDVDARVRAASASALGTFVYLGEVDQLPKPILREVEEELLRVVRGQDVPLVRRKALEALGFSSREEVEPLLLEAYHSGDQDWIISALLAMGRSLNTIWEDEVLAKLDDENAAVRAEAAGAAGELSLRKSTPRLLELLGDDDVDVRAAAIWSLSEIGGEGIREILEEMLDETEDEDEADLLEDALDNLEFVEGMDGFALMDLSAVDEELDDEDDFFEDDGFEDDTNY